MMISFFPRVWLRFGPFFQVVAVWLLFSPVLSPGASVSYVVQMSLDGLGAKYLEYYVSNAPAQFPNFVRLTTEGAATFNARCDYDFSETVPNHATMFTGRPVSPPAGALNTTHHGYSNNFPTATETFHNAGNPNVPYKASMFDVAHDHGLSTAFYASKTRLAICERSYNEINGAFDLTDLDSGRDKIDFASVTDLSGPAISNEVNLLIQDLNGSAPKRYSFIHLAEPDLTGHGSGWGSANWSNAVRMVDAQLGRIFTAIRSNPALSNQTALVITADHGGGGVVANAHTEAYHITNYTIPFFLWGPGVPGGVDLYALMANRGNPGTNRAAYSEQPHPIRDGDASNLSLYLLGLPPIPGSYFLPQMRAFLQAQRIDGMLVLSWPSFAENMVLESSESLNNGVWQRISTGIAKTFAGFNYTVSSSPAPAARFFRLRSPGFAIATPPAAQTVFATQPASFQVAVSGVGTFSYQWLFNDEPIQDATGPTFTLAAATSANAGEYRVRVSDGTDSILSKAAALTVLNGPRITQQPLNQSVVSNATAQFSVQASGIGALSYQWRKDDQNINGATIQTLSVSNVYLPDEGNYSVAVTDANGTIFTQTARLLVLIPPVFVQNPISQTVGAGQDVTFTVTISGNPPPFGFEWRQGSFLHVSNTVTSTTASYTITNVQPSHAGTYRAIVRNQALPSGRISAGAVLTVTNPPAGL